MYENSFLVGHLAVAVNSSSLCQQRCFTFTSPDLPASIQGEASILNSGDLGVKPNALTKVGLAKSFARLPLSFEVNQGQTMPKSSSYPREGLHPVSDPQRGSPESEEKSGNV